MQTKDTCWRWRWRCFSEDRNRIIAHTHAHTHSGAVSRGAFVGYEEGRDCATYQSQDVSPLDMKKKQTWDDEMKRWWRPRPTQHIWDSSGVQISGGKISSEWKVGTFHLRFKNKSPVIVQVPNRLWFVTPENETVVQHFPFLVPRKGKKWIRNICNCLLQSNVVLIWLIFLFW